MRKILPYILIVLTLVQLFAPLALSNGIKINKAEATDSISVVIMKYDTTDTTINANVNVSIPNENRSSLSTSYDHLSLIIKIKEGVFSDKATQTIDLFTAPNDLRVNDVKVATQTFSGLTASTVYSIVSIVEGTKGGSTKELDRQTQDTVTNKTGETNIVSKEGAYAPEASDVSGMPTCSIWPGSFHLGGCIAIGLYWLFFKTTSFVFAGAGKILDFTVMYSIQDTSYRSAFVVQGWGMVRDFCNMFFIFILLYIAFGTILNLHSVKTKEMIINVVIIGLLINFSLFATQVIIDASNILTRVFYNQKTIITGTPKVDTDGNPVLDGNGKQVTTNELGEFGEIKLSEAIVSKVDPQKLIIEAKKVSTVKQKGLDESEQSPEDISAWSFTLVSLLATVVNVVGIIAFLSAGLIFIGRVIGLWLAMILAPLAFFSYTVPALQDMEMIGWKKWWPETLKLAFLAPIFAFFMYLIVGFMEKGLGVIDVAFKNHKATGINFYVAIIVPFIFIMILLMKSKDIAKSMSGKIGQSITSGIGKVAGVGLAAATGGAAFAMRGSIGRLAANAVQSNKFKDLAGRSKLGAMAFKATSGVASSSFDARATKFGATLSKESGVDMGKAKQGGFAKAREEKIHKEEEFAKKLDTGDYGKNQIVNDLTGGNITGDRATQVIEEMKKKKIVETDKNGNELNDQALRAKLAGGNGLSVGNARAVSGGIADQMSSERRSARADKLSSGYSGMFTTNHLAANKIRKSTADLEKARANATMLAELTKQVKATGDGHGAEPKKENKEPAHAAKATEEHAPAGGDSHKPEH